MPSAGNSSLDRVNFSAVTRFETLYDAARESLERFGRSRSGDRRRARRREETACFGVTSIEDPLDVNAETLFQFGSTGKTFTATLAAARRAWRARHEGPIGLIP